MNAHAINTIIAIRKVPFMKKFLCYYSVVVLKEPACGMVAE
jgi:hypothetical protein